MFHHNYKILKFVKEDINFIIVKLMIYYSTYRIKKYFLNHEGRNREGAFNEQSTKLLIYSYFVKTWLSLHYLKLRKKIMK